MIDFHFLSRELASKIGGFRPQLSELVFSVDPSSTRTTDGQPPERIGPRSAQEITTFNSGQFSLRLDDAFNRATLQHEAYLFRTIGELERSQTPLLPESQRLRGRLLQQLYSELERLEAMKSDEWNLRRSRPSPQDSRFFDTGQSSYVYSCRLLTLTINYDL